MAAEKNKTSAASDAKPTTKDSSQLHMKRPSLYGVLLFIMVAMIIYLQAILWVGEGSVAEVWQLKRSIGQLEQENSHLQERNQKLINEVEALRNGKELIEHRAREDLGLIKNNEIFYHVIDESKQEPSNK